MTRFKTTVLAEPETISDLTGDLLAFLAGQNVDARTTHHVALIVEEVLTNLATHGQCSGQPAKLTVTVEPAQVKGEIIDSGAAFDPRKAPDPDLDLAAADRPVGGVGLFLVRQFSRELEYVSDGGQNRTTFAVGRGDAAGHGEG